MTELPVPKIFGDRIMPLLVKVDRELQVLETFFMENEDLCIYEEDFKSYPEIQRRLREIYSDLRNDRIRGDSAIRRIDTQIFEPFEDLCYRLVESKKFPEFWELYEFMEINR